MGSSNNINGMKARDWKVLDTSSIDAAASQQTELSLEQQQLLAAFTSVIKATATDIHGTSADDKYKHIVDLIVKRLTQVSTDSADDVVNELKELLESSSTSGSSDEVYEKLEELSKQLSENDAKHMKQAVDSALAEASLESKFNDVVSSTISDNIAALQADLKTKVDTSKVEALLNQYKEYAESAAKQNIASAKDSRSSKKTFDDKEFLVQFDDKVKLIAVKQHQRAGKISAFLQLKDTSSRGGSRASRFTRRLVDSASRRKRFSSAVLPKSAKESKKGKKDSRSRKKLDVNELVVDEVLLQMSKKIGGLCKAVDSAGKRLIRMVASVVKSLSSAVNKAVYKLNKQKAHIAKLQDIIRKLQNKAAKNQRTARKAERQAREAAAASSASAPASPNINSQQQSTIQQSQQAEDQQQTSSVQQSAQRSPNAANIRSSAAKNLTLNALSMLAAGMKRIGKSIAAVGESVAKLSAKVMESVSKPIFAALMTPAGMYAIGFVAGYVWTRWLKKWVMPIIGLFKKMSGSTIMKILLGAAGVGALLSMVMPALLPMLLPSIGTLIAAMPWVAAIAAIAAGVVWLKGRWNKANKAREEGLKQDNETTKFMVKSAKEQMEASKAIRDKLNTMQSGKEKQEAMKDRLKRMQKAKALYKKIEEQEKEAQDQRMKLNSGFRKYVASGDEIKHWQDKEDSLRRQKMKLLQDNGFDQSDMRDKAARWDKDKMTEEQRLAKSLAEDEVKTTGKVSEDTYKMYMKAFNQPKARYSEKSSAALVNKQFSSAKSTFEAQHPMQKQVQLQSIDQSLQAKSAEQQQAANAIDNVTESTEKIADAVEKNSKDQQEANKQILEKLQEIQQQANVQQSTTNNVSVVAVPSQQNIAQMESNSGRQAF